MSKSSKSNRNAAPAKPAPTLPKDPANGQVRRWMLFALGVFLTAGATWAIFEFVIWNQLPSELVGQWEVVHGPPQFKDAEFQFYRSGKMIGHFNDRGMDRPMHADVRVEDGKLYITTRRETTGEIHVSVQTIRALNSRELVLADEKGQIMRLERIR